MLLRYEQTPPSSPVAWRRNPYHFFDFIGIHLSFEDYFKVRSACPIKLTPLGKGSSCLRPRPLCVVALVAVQDPANETAYLLGNDFLPLVRCLAATLDMLMRGET